MRFKINPLFSFLVGLGLGPIALVQWIKHDGDVPFVGTSQSVPAAENKQASAPPEIPHPNSVDSWDVLFADGKAPAPISSEQEAIDREVVRIMVNLGNDLARASPQLTKFLLDRENEKVCLKCGEVNPASASKGYPADSCHYCGSALKHRPASEPPQAYAARLRESYELIDAARNRRAGKE